MKKFTLSEGIIIALIAAIATIIAAVISGIFLLRSTGTIPPSPTATAIATASPPATAIPTISQLSPLHSANFLQGSQGWLHNAHPSQWRYNDTDKVLESDGTGACCPPLNNIVLVAPYTLKTSDYAVEAQMRVKGLNQPYNGDSNVQEPFFGLYVRGVDSISQGYMAGINGIPSGEPHAGAFSSFLGFGPNLPDGRIFSGKEKGGEDYVLDKEWHTYRIEVKGATFMLKIDNREVYRQPMYDINFSSGPNLGIEGYNCLLQIQIFTVYSL